MNVVDQVRLVLQKYVKPQDALLLGVSGGVDSMVLLTILAQLRSDEELGFSLVAAHVNHSLRGEVSDADQQLVESYCAQLNVPCVAQVVDVAAYAEEKGLGVEEAGREVRYAFFKETVAEQGSDVTVTAHHADDFVETVLMNVVRGTGIAGLSGFLEFSQSAAGPIIRPLLSMGKDDLYAFAQQHTVLFSEDETNEDTAYRRNFLRHKVVPLLKELNPDVRTALLHQGQILQEADQFLIREADAWLQSQAGEHARWSATLSLACLRDSFAVHPPALQKTILRLMYRMLHGHERNMTFDLLQRASELIVDGETGKWIQFGVGHALKLSYETFVFEPMEATATDARDETDASATADVAPQELSIPSATQFGDFYLHLEILAEPPADLPRDAQYLDLDKVSGGRIFVRLWQPGDRFRPLGMKEGHKKLQDFFSDHRVPRSLRTQLPLLCDTQGDILSVGAMRITDDAKIDKTTKRVLKISITKSNVMGSELEQFEAIE